VDKLCVSRVMIASRDRQNDARGARKLLWLMAASLLAGCGGPADVVPLEPRFVESMVLEAPEAGSVRQFPGEVRADRRAELAFRVSGPLVALPVQEGQIVRAGDLLARIDPRDFENEVESRRAAATEARSLFQRVSRALETGAVTVAERDQARGRSDVAAAELTLAENALQDTQLRAPFAGRVARRVAENFQNVQVGEPILILEDIARLEVRVQLPEQDVVRLPPNVSVLGAEVGTVTFPGLPDAAFPVTVKELQTRADARTNTYLVTLGLERPDAGNILPGMSATFLPNYDVVAGRQTYLIPVEAIQATPDGRPFVWLLGPDSRTVQRRSVRMGRLSGRSIEVPDGLRSGDHVIIRGGAYLADGVQVRTRN
jgi:RND family efflux transporter MFP subunit